MSITNKCEECQLSNFVHDQDDMEILLKNVSGNFLELVNDSFVTTNYTKKIMNVLWYPEASKHTFRLSKSIISEKQCEGILVEAFAKKN